MDRGQNTVYRPYDGGSVLLELAAVCALLFFLVNATFGLAQLYRNSSILVEAARAGARAAGGYVGAGDSAYICGLARDGATAVLQLANLDTADHQITIQPEDLNDAAALGSSTPAVRVTVSRISGGGMTGFLFRGSASSVFYLESKNNAVGGC